MAPVALLDVFASIVTPVSNAAAQRLHKRDNMGYAISPSLIVLCCMLGAGALVCCGFAIHRLFIGDTSNTLLAATPEQMDYMREVRERNMNSLSGLTGRRFKQPSVMS